MKKMITVLFAATAAIAGVASAQSAPPYAPLTTDLQARTPYSAYVQDSRGVIARNPFGLCWRTGYWTPAEDKDGKSNTLIYILAYPSPEAREKSWKAFQADPEWHKVREASEVDGKIVQKVVSVFLNPTDYSAIK